MRFAVALLIALLMSLSFAEQIAECERFVPYERDGCYLSRSTSPAQCENINDVHIRDQCFVSIAETHATSYRDCDLLYAEHQPLCYARITYQTDKDDSACEGLHQDFREECYVYFTTHNFPNNVAACESIPPNYKTSCMNRFFSIFSPRDETDCLSMFGPRYLEQCKNYVNSRENVLQKTLSFFESSWVFLTSQNTIMFISLGVSLLVAVLFLRVWSRAVKKK